MSLSHWRLLLFTIWPRLKEFSVAALFSLTGRPTIFNFLLLPYLIIMIILFTKYGLVYKNNFIRARAWNLIKILKRAKNKPRMTFLKIENTRLHAFFLLKNSKNVLGSTAKKLLLKALVIVCIVCIQHNSKFWLVLFKKQFCTFKKSWESILECHWVILETICEVFSLTIPPPKKKIQIKNIPVTKSKKI